MGYFTGSKSICVKVKIKPVVLKGKVTTTHVTPLLRALYYGTYYTIVKL